MENPCGNNGEEEIDLRNGQKNCGPNPKLQTRNMLYPFPLGSVFRLPLARLLFGAKQVTFDFGY